MEEKPKIEAVLHDSFDLLKEKLLTRKIEPKNFLDEIFRLDQSTPERTDSLRAVEIMSQPELVAIFEDTEERQNFYSTRSLAYFHKAQVRISRGDMSVVADLQCALADSLRVGEEDDDWANYVRATIAYLEGNIEELKILEKKLDQNKFLVRNFIKGLEERGYPDYMFDCLRKREK